MARAVVGVPAEHAGHGGVHPCGHEHGHAILYFGVLGVDVGDDGVADDGEGEGEEHDDAAKLQAVGNDGDDHGADGGDGVGDHGPELDFVGGVAAEGLDDGGKLEGVSV